MNKFILCLSLLLSAVTCSASPVNNDDITLYFARHGETLLNSFNHVQGWSDAPLTVEGKQVARYLGAGLRGIPFDRFYSGDVGQQRDTLKIVLRQTGQALAEVTELSGLRESYFGSFEGLRNEEMMNASARVLGFKDQREMLSEMKSGKISIRQLQDAISAADPAGLAEDYKQVKSRVHAALTEIVESAKKQQDKNILIVTSGMTIMNLVYELTGESVKIKPLENASVVKITYSKGNYTINEPGTLKYFNDGKVLLGK
ncbi:histidine phosphatase family protein [Tatumella sp. UBA2305]|uniref:histidine phosphatase family protein n=1 Tax=Tatumella sp. UBA2305 TaxID=1947647 RepID=UPI0025EE9250|nr:histidine phosphatase family protein [Tatumella sp. UBA2305]